MKREGKVLSIGSKEIDDSNSRMTNNENKRYTSIGAPIS